MFIQTSRRTSSQDVGDGVCSSPHIESVAKYVISCLHPHTPLKVYCLAIAKHMRRGRQEDSHEFLRYAIDAMQKSLMHGVPQYAACSDVYIFLFSPYFAGRWKLNSLGLHSFTRYLAASSGPGSVARVVATTVTRSIGFSTLALISSKSIH